MIESFAISSKVFKKILSHKNKLIAGATDGTIAIWNMEPKSLIHEINKHHEEVKNLKLWKDCYISFSPSAICVWNLETSELINEFIGSDFKSIDIFEYYLVAAMGKEIVVYDLHDSQSSTPILKLTQEVSEVKMSGDLIVGKDKDHLYIWDLKTGSFLETIDEKVISFKVYSNKVIIRFAYSPIGVWNKDNFNLKRLNYKKAFVNYFDVKDNKIITLSNIDLGLGPFSTLNTLQVWDVETGSLFKYIEKNVSNCLFNMPIYLKILNKKIVVAFKDFLLLIRRTS